MLIASVALLSRCWALVASLMMLIASKALLGLWLWDTRVASSWLWELALLGFGSAADPAAAVAVAAAAAHADCGYAHADCG